MKLNLLSRLRRTAHRRARPHTKRRRLSRWLASAEALEPRMLLASDLLITEFMALNSETLTDEDGAYSDWIEIHNSSTSPINLAGYYLTDDLEDLNKWQFPDVTLEAGGYLVVFASSKDRRDPAQPLHTNFALSGSGEYLGLVAPDGQTVVHDFLPQFPAQKDDISYGIVQQTTTLVGAGANTSYLVPTAGHASLGTQWTQPTFDDSAWTQTQTVPRSSLLLTEIATGSVDLVEVQNVTNTEIDTSGWVVAVNDGSQGNINSVGPLWALPGSFTPGQVRYSTDSPTDNYWGSDIAWNTNGPGWAMIVDDQGEVVDFVVWGYSQAQISTLNVNVNGFFVSVADVWTGNSISTAGATETNSLKRQGNTDNDSAANFAYSNPRSAGSPNAGLAIPFTGTKQAPTAVPIGYGLVQSGFSVRHVDVNGGADGFLDTATEAKAILDGTFSPTLYNIGADITAVMPVINFGGGAGTFPNSLPYLDGTSDQELEDFAVLARATITIPVGTWTIGFGSDDGGYLRLGNINFSGESGTNGDTPGDNEIRYEAPRGHSWTSGRITVTGSPITTTLEAMFFERGGGDSWEIAIRAGHGDNNFLSSGGTLLSDGALGWSVVTPSAIGVETDVQQVMQNVNASLWSRTTFQVDDPDMFKSLMLQMQYNDGFVAYLNGQEIARRNAPASLAWNSTATASRTPAQTLETENINVTDFLDLLVPGENVLAIHGLNSSAGNSSFLVAPTLLGVSNDTTIRYFDTASPGGPNNAGFVDFVAAPEFSVEHGFYTTSFPVSISSDTPGATIRYTLDGSEPSETNGLLYSGPITVSSTSIIRAYAYRSGYRSEPSVTQTYIFLADVIQQSPDGSPPPGFPQGPVAGQILDYGMDPDIVNHPTWGPQLQEALLALPTMSIVTDIDNLFHPSQGIYVNAHLHGRGAERPASLELIDPNGNEVGFQANAGLRIRGGFSRSDDNPKHALRLFFRDEYGEGKLNYPLFGDEGVDEFDGFDLRTAQNYSWSFGGDAQNIMNRDVFSRDVQREMGQPYTRSRYYHVYINGQYWGIYQSQERAEADYAETYFGGAAEEYDTIKSAGSSGNYQVEATDGTLDAWRELWDLANEIAYAPDQNTAYSLFMKAQGKNPDGTRNPAYPVLLDADNLIEYMLIIYYGGNKDAPISAFLGNERNNNWFAIRNRNGEQAFQFFAHDAEHTLLVGDLHINRVGPWPAGDLFEFSNPQWIHQQLMAVDEYRMRFADLAHKHMFNDGILTPQRAVELFMSRAEEVGAAIVAESARWGDSKVATPRTKADWQNAINNLVNNYFPQRTSIVISQFQTAQRWTDPLNNTGLVPAPLYPSLPAPVFSKHGGSVNPGFELLMPAQAPQVYYTLDGSDPRLPGGEISPTAIPYDPSASVSTLIAAGSEWKYLDNGSNQGTAWRGDTFNDASWSTGVGEFGYGDGGEATIINFGPDPNNKFITTYFRKTFNVADTSRIAGLTLRLLRDDGAIVYINGQEVARSNMPGGNVTHQTTAISAVGGADESTFYTFSIPASVLREGNNVIAVEVHQSGGNSTDFSFNLALEALVSNALPVVLNDSVLVRARSYDNGTWSALNEAQFFTNTPASAANLRVTELQYNAHPPTPAELLINPSFAASDFDFVELRNISDEPIDLSGVQFTTGITATIASGSIPPGGFALVVKNQQAFEARYGGSLPVVGVFSGQLDNAGEQLVLRDRFGGIIHDFVYDDSGSWPGRADGRGSSLEILDIHGDYNDSENWRASTEYGGTPGLIGTGPLGDVVINEVLAHTDLPDRDSIELHNTTTEPINIGGWWISDESANYFKFRIPDGTILPAGGYIVFNDLDFNSSGGPNDFLLSALGDDVWLVATDASGKPTRFVDHVEFDATANGESLGRWPNGGDVLAPMTSLTLGGPNSGPRVGPVVITEIMYNPPDPDGAGPIDPNNLEFVEIYNPTSSAVNLTEWQFNVGINFAFPAGRILPAHSVLVVVPFDPNNPLNASLLSTFRSFYGISPTVPLVGPFTGRLDNAGETVRLSRPDDPPAEDPNLFPLMIEDEVGYGDAAPWPTSADGLGHSLQRLTTTGWGYDASTWQAGVPTPGMAFPNAAPFKVNNTGATVDEGGSVVLTTSHLRYDDLDFPPSQVRYTITTAPQRGRLELTTAPGAAISTFTQSQIDAGIVRYVHDGSDIASDGFQFSIRDGNNNQLTGQSFAITVTLINTAPHDILLSGTLVGENQPGAVIGTVTVADDDVGDQHNLTVSDSRFQIVGNQLRLQTGVSLNHEVTPQITLEITATDLGGLSLVKSFVITVGDANEFLPQLSPRTFSVPENSPVGFEVGIVTGTDGDTSQILSYAITGGNFGNVFAIDSATGRITVQNPAGLDFELIQQYQLQVTVSDNVAPIRSAAATITINITDVNEQGPTGVTLSKTTVAEKQLGAIVGTVTVIDPNPNDNHTVQVNDARFEVVAGQLRLKPGVHLLRSQQTTINIQITATDSGTPPLSKTENFTLTVTENTHPWRNPNNPLDVDGDGAVTPLDSLLVINYLNNIGAGALPIPRDYFTGAGIFVDTTRDNEVTSLDSLVIINFLNGVGTGEGEAAAGAPDSDGESSLSGDTTPTAAVQEASPDATPARLPALLPALPPAPVEQETESEPAAEALWWWSQANMPGPMLPRTEVFAREASWDASRWNGDLEETLDALLFGKDGDDDERLC